MEDFSQVRGVNLFSQETSNRTRRNGLKFHQRRFRLAVKKTFLTEKMVEYWNRLPRAVVESPSLGTYKNLVDVPLKDVALAVQG